MAVITGGLLIGGIPDCNPSPPPFALRLNSTHRKWHLGKLKMHVTWQIHPCFERAGFEREKYPQYFGILSAWFSVSCVLREKFFPFFVDFVGVFAKVVPVASAQR